MRKKEREEDGFDMNKIFECPVCETPCDNGAISCTVCGHEDKKGLVRIFVDGGLDDWLKNTIEPKRQEWKIKNTPKTKEDELKFQIEQAKRELAEAKRRLEEKKEKDKIAEEARKREEILHKELMEIQKQIKDTERQLEGDPKYNAKHVKNSSKLETRQKSQESLYEQISRGKVRLGANNWIVLEKNDKRVLLLSETIIASKPYNKRQEKIRWEKCSLRRYLNMTVLGEFQRHEKLAVEEINSDKIFLLSAEEFIKYSNIIMKSSIGAESWWWLRSSGKDNPNAIYVSPYGKINQAGNPVSTISGGVRPALWLTLSKV